MAKPPFSFDAASEPLADRVAIGLQKIGLALKQQTYGKASEEGLSPTQGQILALLASGAGTASELAARLGVSLPTISDSVRVLVDKALVVKAPDPRHPRASLLSLTAEGKKKSRKALAWPEFLATAVDAMSEAEQEVFLGGLTKMIRSLQESGQVPLQAMCATCTYFRPHVREGDTPHHCAFVDAPMGARHLRLVCDEHVPAPESERAELWRRFVGG